MSFSPRAVDQRTRRRSHLRVVFATSFAVVVVLLLASSTAWLFERKSPEALIRSFPDSLWWAVETISTVGYGDLHPVTTGGRMVAMGLMATGIALIGVITATVVSWFFDEVRLMREVEDIESAETVTAAKLDRVLEEVRQLREQVESIEGTRQRSG